jgi:hypothetical protein
MFSLPCSKPLYTSAITVPINLSLEKTGTVLAVVLSGSKRRSESSMYAKPLIEEPSNPMPCLKNFQCQEVLTNT